MSEHRVLVSWQRDGQEFDAASYSRNHVWKFPNGVEVPASAAADYKGDPSRVDPEAAYAASLSSCHMLTFLFLAARKGFVIEHYEDDAVALLAKNEEGKMAVTEVKLSPKIEFSGDSLPSEADLDQLHHAAHENCFIANSVKTKISIEK